jgi:sugar phosphate isomerase/epimerase
MDQHTSEDEDMNRRDFLMSSAAAAGVAAGLTSLAQGADAAPAASANGKSGPAKPAVLKISSQERRIPGKSLREKVEKLQSWGAVGVELASKDLASRVNEIKEAVKGTKVAVSAVCSGYFKLIDPDEAKRKQGAQELKDLCGPAGEVGSVGLIMVPAFNKHPQLPVKEARQVLVDILPELGEAAQKAGTRIILEPLNRGEAFFLRMLADAASICRDVDHPGVAMMGDFYHMCKEETSDLGAFISSGKYLQHVHLASRQRNLPGQDDRSFVDGFRGLKMIGYQGFCSLECSCKGDPDVETPKSFRFLEQQWKEATI